MHHKMLFVIFFIFAIHICLSLFSYLPFPSSSFSWCSFLLFKFWEILSIIPLYLTFRSIQNSLLTCSQTTTILFLKKAEEQKKKKSHKINKTKSHKLICNYFSFTKWAIWDVYMAERRRFFKRKFKNFVYYFKTK